MDICIADTSTQLGSLITELLANRGHTLSCLSQEDPYGNNLSQKLQTLTSGRQIDMVVLPALAYPGKEGAPVETEANREISLCQCITDHFSSLARKPQLLICLSSIAYYGNTENTEQIQEGSKAGKTAEALFFESVEKTTAVAGKAQIRTVILRPGVIVSPDSHGILKGRHRSHIRRYFDDSKQLLPWVSRNDAIRAISFILDDSTICGPVNLVSGDVITRLEMGTMLKEHFAVPATPPLPSFLARVLHHPGKDLLPRNLPKAAPLLLMNKGFLFQDISLLEYLKAS